MGLQEIELSFFENSVCFSCSLCHKHIVQNILLQISQSFKVYQFFALSQNIMLYNITNQLISKEGTFMKKIGLIGGMGPVSTIDYYQQLVTKFQQVHPNICPPIVIDSLDVFELLTLEETGNKQALLRVLLTSLNNLKNAGASLAALTANTPHMVFDELVSVSPLPLISIVDSTLAAIKKNKQTKIGLLGTKMTMELGFYQKRLQSADINLVTPSAEQIDTIHQIISKELEVGIVTTQSKQKLLEIIKKMSSKNNLDGIILGCTELPLILSQKDIAITVYDTVSIHVDDILNVALQE
ncbi:aspartate racemase [Liquorilactobacillus mali KCTC 3596 = DSM 20444]|uniref:Aspartate racemase n=2 Tax=Liquorilactobacillus mali TaxID=1618 RepID=A0A0R2E482_9LACO|nr:aspartate racemase [Liquorilactobacillus mali KCTC 3596 = DSM 20444]